VAKAKKQKSKSKTIALNKKAKHDYFIEDRYEAGLALKAGKSKVFARAEFRSVRAIFF